jgi:hypothetical protein
LAIDIDMECKVTDVCVDGKRNLDQIMVRYVGNYGGAHSQPAKKVKISQRFKKGTVNVTIEMSSGKFKTTDLSSDNLSNLAPGSEFTIHARPDGMFPNFVNFKINKMRAKFYTSCKKDFPLNVGDQFGSLLITGYRTTLGRQCRTSPSFKSTANSMGRVRRSEHSEPPTSESGLSAISPAAATGAATALIVIVAMVAMFALRARSNEVLSGTKDPAGLRSRLQRQYTGSEEIAGGLGKTATLPFHLSKLRERHSSKGLRNIPSVAAIPQ